MMQESEGERSMDLEGTNQSDQEGKTIEGLFGPFKELAEKYQARSEKPRRFHVIVNPAAGRDQPILKTLNAAFKAIGADWDVFVTKEAGDARRLAEEAVKAEADVVAVHGGDGTIMEVATGLIGSHIPMAILPGGTANVMSRELNIPTDLVAASALAINPDALIRKVDLGRIEDHYFILRAGVGFEAAMVQGADRELKDRLGIMAYTFSALQALSDTVIAKYTLTLDGQEVQTDGLTCIIANSGNVGAAGMAMAPNIDISDGLLDVIVVTRADLPSLISIAASVVGGSENKRALQHWQVKEVQVHSDPAQILQVDGEIVGETPFTAQVIPDAIRVIVPARVDAELKG